MFFGLRYDTRQFDARGAAGFLDTYVEAIDEVVDAAALM
jgi:hypothetical protein